jgi:5-(carboxyamino)imidazole ribonucleotide synthase
LEETRAAFLKLGPQPCVLERLLPLELELSVVVARGFDGSIVSWPVAENQHAHGILDITLVPARISKALAEQARSAAVAVASHLGYNGVLCVEFFVLRDGRILANEIAPLGATELHCPAVMVNLLGELWAGGEPRWEHVLRHPGAKLHLYGKAEARAGRKMGHFTVLAPSGDAALAVALEAKSLLLSEAQAGRLKSA